MLNCRDCRGETRVIAENVTEAATGGSQAARKVRECIKCGTRADSTETWDEDGTVEHYRARYEQAAKWISNLAFLVRAPALTAKMADDWVRQDLERHAAGAGPERTGGRQRIASRGRKVPKYLNRLPTPGSGILMSVWTFPGRGRSRRDFGDETHGRGNGDAG